MTTLTVTYTFANGTANDGPQVSTNFSDVTSYINSNCIVKDGSLALTGLLSGPATDPTSDNHLTRKLYVDRRVGSVVSRTSSGTKSFTAVDGTYRTLVDITVTVPSGKLVYIYAQSGGILSNTGSACEYVTKVGISLDGTAGSLTYGGQCFGFTAASGGRSNVTPWHYVAGTTSGTSLLIRLQGAQNTTLGGLPGVGSLVETNTLVQVTSQAGLTL